MSLRGRASITGAAASNASIPILSFPVKVDNNDSYRVKLEQLFPLIDNNSLKQSVSQHLGLKSKQSSSTVPSRNWNLMVSPGMLAAGFGSSKKWQESARAAHPLYRSKLDLGPAPNPGESKPESKTAGSISFGCTSTKGGSRHKNVAADNKAAVHQKEDILRPSSSKMTQTSRNTFLKPPPPLTPKLKHLKSRFNDFSSSKAPIITPTKFLPFSQTRRTAHQNQNSTPNPAGDGKETSGTTPSPTKVSKGVSATKQYSSITAASSHYLSSTTSAKGGPAKSMVPPAPISHKSEPSEPSPAPTPSEDSIPKPKSTSSTSKKSKSAVPGTNNIQGQGPELVATTTEVNLLKLSPRNPNQIKSGLLIDDKPQKTLTSKKVLVSRSSEERDDDPESIYLDSLGLKYFPSIDSSETELKLLSLQNNFIHKIDSSSIIGAAASFSNLLVLDLYNNRIDRISGLRVFNCLKVLLLGKNRIRRIEGLDTLKHLEIVDLHGNQLRYLDNINALVSLRVLNVAGNVIRSVRNFGPYGVSSLHELNLKRNNLHNLAGILKMVHLKKICLGNNNIQTISMLYPLRKLEHLVELFLEPNPICELPDYINQVLALLPNLELLDSLGVTNELRSIAANWYRKKVVEEQERRRQLDKMKLQSLSSTRDEVIVKAKKRWESLRNYVRQNSIGSNQGRGQTTSSTSNLVPSFQPASGNKITNQVVRVEKKFTVEMKPEEDEEEPEKLESGSTSSQSQPESEDTSCSQSEDQAERNVTSISNAKTISGVHGRSESRAKTIAASSSSLPLSIANSITLPSNPSNRISSAKVAVVRPSVRQKINSAIECAEEHPGATVITSDNNSLSMLTKAIADVEITTASEAPSVIEEDVEEESELKDQESSLDREPTLLADEPMKQPVERGQALTTPIVHHQVIKYTDDTHQLPQPLKVLRRSFTSNVLLPPLPSSSQKKPFNLERFPRRDLKKKRSRSSIDLQSPKNVLNDSESTSDLESLATTVNSEAGSTTTTTSTTTTANTSYNNSPRIKRSGTSRPKLVRSLSSRNLKPHGKTARAVGTNGSGVLESRRPLTSVASVDRSNNRGGPLRRSESASTLDSYNNEMIVKKQGVDYLIEINGKMLNIYGQGALKHVLNAFSTNSTGTVTIITFNFITFDSLVPYFSKLKQVYPALEHFQFRANGLQYLAQLNALADLQGMSSLYIFPEGNSVVENQLWEEYAIYRLGHWGLGKLNGNEVSSDYRNIGSLTSSSMGLRSYDVAGAQGTTSIITFEALGYLALSCLPQSALTPLAERLHTLHCFCCCSTSNSSEESGRNKRSDGQTPNTSAMNKCTSYWDDDPVLLDVIGKEALSYIPQNEGWKNISTRTDVAEEIFESGCEILEKLDKLEQMWPTLMAEMVEEILVDYQVMDSFMKKELLRLKNNLSANTAIHLTKKKK